MTAPVNRMLFVILTLRLSSPAAIAAPESLPDTDLASGAPIPVARNPWGEPVLPASSLAGSLRAQLRVDDPALCATLLGSEPGHEELTASPLRFLGTKLALPSGQVLGIRRRTAIDRHRGAATAKTLRAHETLPVDTRITCYLRLDHSPPGGAGLDEQLLRVLHAWRPYVGGGRSTGFGSTETLSISYGTIDLNTQGGLTAWLTRGGDDLVYYAATQPYPIQTISRAVPARRLAEPWLRVDWRIADAIAIHSGVSTPSAQAESREITQVIREGEQLIIPGTTWKGLLRARCEFILRSIAPEGHILTCDSTVGTCGECELCDAFGWSTTGPRPDDLNGARAKLEISESTIRDAHVVTRNHVAIDRVFGGAMKGALFRTEAIEAGDTELVITTDPARPLGEPELIRALVTLACYDIHDGYVGVGSATTRGQGTLHLTHDLDRANAVQALNNWITRKTTA